MRHLFVIAVLVSLLLSSWGGTPHACAMPAPGTGSAPADHAMPMPAAEHMAHGGSAAERGPTTSAPCHEMPGATPMSCCDSDERPGACGDCDCATAGAQTGALHSVVVALTLRVESSPDFVRDTGPPDPPPGALLRPPILLT